MKFIISIYKDGKLVDTKVNKDDFDWKWFKKKYTNKIDQYLSRGWESAISSSSGSEGYTVLFNIKGKKSVYFSYINETLLDLKDADGKNISLNKIYTNDYGDIYSFGLGYFKSDGEFYIRKHLPRGWSDSHDPSQKQIDQLSLHVKKD